MLNSSSSGAARMLGAGRHCRRTIIARHHKRKIQCNVALLNHSHYSSFSTNAIDNFNNTSNSDTNTAPSQQQQQQNPYYPQMFTPLFLGTDIGTLPNRVIMGSMHTGLEGHSIPSTLLWAMNASNDHQDMTKMAKYFEERAKGGVGLMGEFFHTTTHTL
jgi:2,4-dienoyl-CoA reductase (NADPH2)